MRNVDWIVIADGSHLFWLAVPTQCAHWQRGAPHHVCIFMHLNQQHKLQLYYTKLVGAILQVLQWLIQTAGSHTTNPTSLLRFQHHFNYLSPVERTAMLGKLRISAVMEGFSFPKSFKCFFRSFSTRGNFWGKLFSPFSIHVLPRKGSKLKILNIGTKWDSKSQIAGTRMCVHATHVEACMHLLLKVCALPWTCYSITDLK